MAFSKLLPLQTLAVSLVLALGLLGVVALLGVGEAAAQEDDWTGVAEFSLDADVIQGQQPGEPARSAAARMALQRLIDSVSVRLSVAADGTRQQQVLWNDATLLDLRADVTELPEMVDTEDGLTDPADVEPFDLPAAARVDLTVAMRMADDLGLSPREGAGFPSMEEFAGQGSEEARLPQDLLPVLRTVLSGGWIGVDGPLDPGQLPERQPSEHAGDAVWDVIEHHLVVTEPDTDQSLEEWEAAIDVQGLLTGLCALAESSDSEQAAACEELRDVQLLDGGEAVVQATVDDTADPVGLLQDITPDVSLTWDELFELARQLH